MRRQPQVGCSLASRSTNTRSSVVTADRPQRRRWVHRRRTRSRCHRSSVLGCTNSPAIPIVAASPPARPAPHGRPSPAGVGSPVGGVPRPRAATPVAPRSWSPNAAPALPAIPAIPATGRGSGRGVVAPSTDHLRRSLPPRSRSSEAVTDFLAPTGLVEQGRAGGADQQRAGLGVLGHDPAGELSREQRAGSAGYGRGGLVGLGLGAGPQRERHVGSGGRGCRGRCWGMEVSPGG
jgi:hypothetical protein